MLKNFNYFLQAVIIYLFFIIGKLLGRHLSKKIFSYLFSKLGPFFKSKDVINRNLKIFNKNLNNFEREKIITNMWRNYGFTFIEYIFLKSFRKNNKHINIVGEEVLKKIILKNKPVIFISGHFSNFELMSMEITKKKIPLATIYRPLNNFFLNPFMEYLRKKYVCKNQIKKGVGGVKESIEYIRKGFSIALMIDQRVSEGELINFFNKPALTTTLPAQLALKFNLSIVPVFIEREKNGFYKIQFYDEIDSSTYSDKMKLSLKLNSLLEMFIKKNPNEWIWTHNRWK